MIEILNTDCLNYLSGDTPLFDLVIADPPYSSGGMVRGDRMVATKTKYMSSESGNQDKLPDFLGDTRDQRGYLTWSWLWMSAAMERMKDGAIIGVFTDWRQLPVTTDAIQCAGFVWRGVVPWWKPTARPQPDRFTSSCEYLVWATKGARPLEQNGATYPEGFFRHSPPQDRIHVTEKPVDLYRHIYKVLRDGGAILDPFVGSGASAVAADMEGRGLSYVGCELSPGIYASAAKRLADHQSAPRLFDAPTVPEATQTEMEL